MSWERRGPNDYRQVRASRREAARRQAEELVAAMPLDQAAGLLGLTLVEALPPPDRPTAVRASSSSETRRASRALKAAGLLGKYYKGPRA